MSKRQSKELHGKAGLPVLRLLVKVDALKQRLEMAAMPHVVSHPRE